MHNLLKNRRYIGEYRYSDTITPNGLPAIVPEDVFKQVAERMDIPTGCPSLRIYANLTFYCAGNHPFHDLFLENQIDHYGWN